MLKVTQEALTFDDVLLVPNQSSILPSEASLKTFLTSKIQLNIPLISAAMDTVTESELAISIAQEGGIGIIHKNLTAQQQADEVTKVKKFESGIITSPVVTSPDCSIKEVIELTAKHKISGVPVVKGKDLVGIVTARDLRFVKKVNPKVSTIMTPKERLVTVQEGASKEKVKKLFHENRIEKILVINTKFQLKGMITVKDMQKSKDFPNACKDGLQRLRVGAAIGVGKDTEDRLKKLTDAEVDAIVVDTAHGHSKMVIDAVKSIRKKYPKLQLIAGNIATKEAAKALIKAGVDAVKVGIGPGSICTTRLVAGIGVPQLSAILSVRNGIKNKKVKIIADGGIKYSGDLAKAFAAGADAVMIGSLFAGTDEAPGKMIKRNGKYFKSFRGMGSVGAMNKGSADRYFQSKQKDRSKYVPEGVEGFAKYKGNVASIIYKLIGGLRSSMGYLGSKQIKHLRYKPKFVKITKAGFYESMVHNVDIIKSDTKY